MIISPDLTRENTHITGETVVIYDNSENALSLVARDSSSVTFLNVITHDEVGIHIGGGAYNNDITRNYGEIGWKDNVPRHFLTMISGNNLVKNHSTVGINTRIPKHDEYVLDINGPTSISHSETTEIYASPSFLYGIYHDLSLNMLYGVGDYGASIGNIAYPQYVLSSVDGGFTWSNELIETDSNKLLVSAPYRMNAIYHNGNMSVVVGENGFVYYKEDNSNWVQRSISVNNGVSVFQLEYNSVYITDNDQVLLGCGTNSVNSIHFLTTTEITYTNTYPEQIWDIPKDTQSNYID
jgi:hypothetical protein